MRCLFLPLSPHFFFGFIPLLFGSGSIKELRETPLKRHQRFVEFFDIRDAARALREMNGKQIHGKRLVIQFSRPGGHGRRFFAGMDSTTPSSTSSTAAPRCPLAVPREPSKKSSSSNVSPRSRLSQTQHPTKKSSVGVKKRSSNGGAVEASMASLCLTGSVACGIEDSDGVPRRNPKKSPSSPSTAKQQQQQQAQRYRPWKGRHKNFDSHFLIDDDAVTGSHSGDSRTTVMIKNIPNKYRSVLVRPFNMRRKFLLSSSMFSHSLLVVQSAASDEHVGQSLQSL